MRVRKGYVDRWKRNAATASETYVEGINNPREDWANATANSEKNWSAGIQAAISKGSFASGVRKAGSEKQKRGAITKGKDRYALGVQYAESAYASGIAPYIQVLEGLSLPPRGLKGDPNNINRVKAVNTALRNKKMGG